MSEKRLSEELSGIEAALGSLTPAASSIQRDRLLFLAGRSLADRIPRPRRRPLVAWLWPCATAVSLLTATVFASLWIDGGRPAVVERVVYVTTERPAVPLDGSIATTSPSAFANWREAPSVRGRRTDLSSPPSTPPAQQAPRNPETRDRSHAVQSLT